MMNVPPIARMIGSWTLCLFLGPLAWAQLPPPVRIETPPSSNQPVQRAGHVEMFSPYAPMPGLAEYWGSGGVAAVPHAVIQPPKSVPVTTHSQPTLHPSGSHGVRNHLHAAHQKAGATVAPLTHPPGVANDPSAAGPGRLGVGEHWIKQAPFRPTIPGASVQPRWKTPYSYGYFGAEGKRRWTRQHGYRDRSLQWTLR